MIDFNKIFTREVLTEIAFHAGVVVAILLFTVITAKVVRKTMGFKQKIPAVDSTQYKFLSHLLSGLIYCIGFVACIYSIPYLRGLATPIFAGSGVLALVIGFASQQAFSNIVGGIFIAIFKPFRLGDRLKFIDKDFIGIVEDITLRHTVICTFDNKRIIVPNSVISSEILINENIVDEKTVKFFDMGISYDSDVDLAMEIIKEEAMKHPEFIDIRTEEQIAEGVPPVVVRIIGFGESSVNLRCSIWAKNPPAAFFLGCDLNKSVKKRFDEEGIEIPFPYRTLVFKNEPDKNEPALKEPEKTT